MEKFMNLESILSGVKSIAITGHVRPDGDCIGSSLGLYNYIKTYYPEKKVEVYLEELQNKFQFLNGANLIKHEWNEGSIFDACFILDCGSSDRVGFAKDVYENAKEQYCVDHHISNQASGENFLVVPTASSTSELIYNLIPKEQLTKEIAECLYMGIAHDTGVFQYSNVAPSTMRAAAELLELGIEASKILEDTFFEKTYLQNFITGKAFTDSKLRIDGRCLTYVLTYEEMQELGITSKDLEGIASQLRNTVGVDVVVFLYALNPTVYKVSLRSNDEVDASVIATLFHGGGHKKAAGFDREGAYEETLELVVEQIRKQIC